jgi:hypothetical protein
LTDCTEKITAVWPLINRLAERRFPGGALAEEGALFVLNRLEEDDCRRLQGYSGRAKFSTFVSALTIRLLEDFSRIKFGRPRPPQWVTALGGTWVTLFQLLCLQRLGVSDAVETIKTRKPAVDPAQIEEDAWTLLERIVHCGTHQGLEVSLTEGEDGPVHAENGNTPEDDLCKRERNIFFSLLFADLKQENDNTTGAAEMPVLSGICLNGQERLLLKLCFQDDLSVTRAGQMLGLNANQAHGRLRRLLARLRSDFDAAGISDDLREMLHG